MRKPLNDLITMLTYKRPHESATERAFVQRYLVPLGAKPDAFGNMLLRIGTAPILWSAHTDTVHRTEGRQRVRVRDGVVRLRANPPTECLGADDTTGVWLLREMVLAGVEGLYVWHSGEEHGCLGSYWLGTHTPEVLDGITYAIAFDRRGYDSIVTHQCCARTCSDAFAWSLAEALSLGDVLHPDPTGVFTDTEVYAGLIPECTNVSVGYHGAHGSGEEQHLGFAALLRECVLQADFTTLVCARTPEPKAKYGWDNDPWWWTKDDDAPREGYDYCLGLHGDVVDVEACTLCGALLEKDERFSYEGMLVCYDCKEEALEEDWDEEDVAIRIAR
jgi:hypothetical protein